MAKSFLPVLFIILFISCKSALIKKYQITDPKPENNESIAEFLSNHGVKQYNDFVFRDMESYIKAVQGKFISVPDVLFFNNQGLRVLYSKTAKECNAGIEGFIKDLSQFNSGEIDTGLEIKELYELISIDKLPEESRADITVFVLWSVYAGKLNDEKAFLWLNMLKTAKESGLNINIHLLNCDLQEGWDYTNVDISAD